MLKSPCVLVARWVLGAYLSVGGTLGIGAYLSTGGNLGDDENPHHPGRLEAASVHVHLRALKLSLCNRDDLILYSNSTESTQYVYIHIMAAAAQHTPVIKQRFPIHQYRQNVEATLSRP